MTTTRRTPAAVRMLTRAAQKRRLKPVKSRRNNRLPSSKGEEKHRRDYISDYHSADE